MITALVHRFSAVHINHKRIASGAVLIGLLTIVAKGFAAAREIAVAWRYGVSSTADAYQLALTGTTWVPMMLAGVMAVVLVPRLVQLDQKGAERQNFVGELNAGVLVLGLAVAALTWLAAPAVAALLASHANAKTLHLTAAMTAQMAPVALFVTLSGYLCARLQSRQRFGYTVTEALPALAIASFVIGQGAFADGRALIIGTLVGYLLQVLTLGAMTSAGDPPLGGLGWSHRSTEWQTLYSSILLMVLGQFLITASIPIDQGFAATLGQGAIASLGYANRIISLFSGLATIVVGRALLPVLSGAVAAGDLAVGRRQALQWSAFLFAASAIGSAILSAFAPEIVRLLFQRGAFTAAASEEVASILRYGLVQLPFYFAGIALVQWYAAVGRFRAFCVINVGAIVLKAELNMVLTPKMGVAGIMLSTALMYVFTFSCLAGFVGRLGKSNACRSRSQKNDR